MYGKRYWSLGGKGQRFCFCASKSVVDIETLPTHRHWHTNTRQRCLADKMSADYQQRFVRGVNFVPPPPPPLPIVLLTHQKIQNIFCFLKLYPCPNHHHHPHPQTLFSFTSDRFRIGNCAGNTQRLHKRFICGFPC